MNLFQRENISLNPCMLSLASKMSQLGEIFYSRYFLVPKKDSSLRPILEIRVLTKHFEEIQFQNVRLILRALRRRGARNTIFTEGEGDNPSVIFVQLWHLPICTDLSQA